MTFASNRKKKIVLASSLLLSFVLIYNVLNYQMNVFKYFFSSKVWAHRVNSIEKYQEAKTTFKGVELDLVFRPGKNHFDVNHPPTKSINLTLFDFLKSNKENLDFNLWLDFKNPKASNYQQSVERLVSITAALNLNVENIIVELKNPAFLEDFSKKGFKTSYYIDNKNIVGFTEEDLIFQKKLIASSNLDFISSDVRNYFFMKEKFPNTKRLTWIIDNPPKIKNFKTLKRSAMDFARNFIVLIDNDVEVVLFSFKAKSGNR